MATKLKIIDDVADIGPAPKVPEFDIAPNPQAARRLEFSRAASPGD